MPARATPVDAKLIEQELVRILNSPEFASSTRLKDFLSYIVSEACAGRSDGILGKTIAQDVYARGADADGKGLSLVKVDAGRLRRRLDEYYAGTGSDNPMHIVIHRGGYEPSFEQVGSTHAKTDEIFAGQQGEKLKTSGLTGALPKLVAIGLVILVAVFWWSKDRPQQSGQVNTDTRSMAERQALLDKSPSALQAVNIAKQARALIFPPMDPARLQATRNMFERAIELDPDYYGGYAGAAQTIAMQAVLSPPGAAPDALITTARQHAEHGVLLRPDASWSQSALAWVHFSSREFDQANEISMRAVAIDPTDFNALEFDGIIALFSGEFDRALQSADPARHKGRVGFRFMFRNTFAVSSFHLGQYEDTIRFLDDAAQQGDPVSQISVTYLAAANHRLGNTKLAAKLAQDFQNTWPNARIDLVLGRVFSDQRFADDVIEAFKSAGWSP